MRPHEGVITEIVGILRRYEHKREWRQILEEVNKHMNTLNELDIDRRMDAQQNDRERA